MPIKPLRRRPKFTASEYFNNAFTDTVFSDFGGFSPPVLEKKKKKNREGDEAPQKGGEGDMREEATIRFRVTVLQDQIEAYLNLHVFRSPQTIKRFTVRKRRGVQEIEAVFVDSALEPAMRQRKVEL